MSAFDGQPTLSGTLVTLRPLQASDFDALFAVGSNPKVWEQHPNSDRYLKPVFRGYFDGAMASGSALLATETATGRVIGCSRYHGFDAMRREVEIGWSFLSCDVWGGAHNRQMKALMLAHAFKYVDTVVFLVGPTNTRSRRAMEKIGGVLQGERPNDDGRPSVVYAITRTAFSRWPEAVGTTK